MPTIPNGTFAVAAPVCKSSGKPPEYTDKNALVTLRDFTSLSKHGLQISGPTDVIETFQDADCSLVVLRRLTQNQDGRISFALFKQHTWTPATCTLEVFFDNGPLSVANKAEVFADTDSMATEWTYDVAVAVDGSYQLATPNESPINSRWGTTFGCSNPDQIMYSWK